MTRMTMRQVVEQSIEFMSDQEIDRIEMASGTHSTLFLAGLISEDIPSKLVGIPVDVAPAVDPNEIHWVRNDIPVHVVVIPHPSYSPELVDA